MQGLVVGSVSEMLTLASTRARVLSEYRQQVGQDQAWGGRGQGLGQRGLRRGGGSQGLGQRGLGQGGGGRGLGQRGGGAVGAEA